MPYKPKTPCAWNGCPRLTDGRFCEEHEQANRREHKRRYDAVYEKTRPSAASRGYGPQWRKLRAWYIKRHPICEYGDCFEPTVDVHHKIPKAQGGPDTEDNLQALCHKHHSLITSRSTNRPYF